MISLFNVFQLGDFSVPCWFISMVYWLLHFWGLHRALLQVNESPPANCQFQREKHITSSPLLEMVAAKVATDVLQHKPHCPGVHWYCWPHVIWIFDLVFFGCHEKFHQDWDHLPFGCWHEASKSSLRNNSLKTTHTKSNCTGREIMTKTWQNFNSRNRWVFPKIEVPQNGWFIMESL